MRNSKFLNLPFQTTKSFLLDSANTNLTARIVCFDHINYSIVNVFCKIEIQFHFSFYRSFVYYYLLFLHFFTLALLQKGTVYYVVPFCDNNTMFSMYSCAATAGLKNWGCLKHVWKSAALQVSAINSSAFSIFSYLVLPSEGPPVQYRWFCPELFDRASAAARYSVAKSGVITPKWRFWTPMWREKIWGGVKPPKSKNVAFFNTFSILNGPQVIQL